MTTKLNVTFTNETYGDFEIESPEEGARLVGDWVRNDPILSFDAVGEDPGRVAIRSDLVKMIEYDTDADEPKALTITAPLIDSAWLLAGQHGGDPVVHKVVAVHATVELVNPDNGDRFALELGQFAAEAVAP